MAAPMAEVAAELTAEQNDALEQLRQLGFTEEQCLTAVRITTDLDQCAEFIVSGRCERLAAVLKAICGMGFSYEEAEQAVKATNSLNVQTAVSWLLSRKAAQGKPAAPASEHKATPIPELKIGNDEVEAKQLVHHAVWDKDTVAIRQFATRPHLLNLVDHHGNTPISLAHQLGHFDILHLLMEQGADPRVPNGRGWTVLQEACLRKQPQVVTDVYMHVIIIKAMEWEKKLPGLRSRLEQIPDFYMEIQWTIESWIPLVSMITPSDTFKIWKKGRRLRFDSTFRGMDGVSVAKGLVSFMFSGDTIQLVDHDRKLWEDALSHFRNPSFEQIEAEVAGMLKHDLGRSDMQTDSVEFAPALSMWGSPRVEEAGGYECNVVDMSGLRFSVVTLSVGAAANDSVEAAGGKSDETSGVGILANKESYFSPKASADSADASSADQTEESKDQTGLTVSNSDVTAQLWMSDKFPLSQADLISVIDIIAPASPDIAKLRDILSAKLPAGFPVKLVIPVLPTLSASVTFSKFERKNDIDDSVFDVPRGFRLQI